MITSAVTIVDYGIGNLRSLEKALESVGARVTRSDSPADVAAADRLVVPGVGAFGACSAEIRRRNLVDPIRSFAHSGRPLLGVCVGMQLLFEESNELGRHDGLGLIEGDVTRFASSESLAVSRLKVPHMGWNAVTIRNPSPILEGLDEQPYFYFVHSYYVRPRDESAILGCTDYGVSFASIVGQHNVFGVQFHPEKSQRSGLRILKNFSNL